MDEQTYTLTRAEIELVLSVIENSPIIASRVWSSEAEIEEKAALLMLEGKLIEKLKEKPCHS